MLASVTAFYFIRFHRVCSPIDLVWCVPVLCCRPPRAADQSGYSIEEATGYAVLLPDTQAVITPVGNDNVPMLVSEPQDSGTAINASEPAAGPEFTTLSRAQTEEHLTATGTDGAFVLRPSSSW